MQRLPLLLALFLFAAPAASAATWERISGKTMGTSEQPALYRTSDGVLHVVWVRREGDPYDYVNTRIRLNGTIAGSTQILANWDYLNLPKVIRGPSGGMRVVFSGHRNTTAGDPFSSGAIFTTTGTGSGTSWAAPNPSQSMSNDHLAGGPVGAAVDSGGLAWAAWANTGTLKTHAGVDPDNNPSNDLDQTWQVGGAYDPDLAVDGATGAVVLGWFSLKDDQHGLYAQQIAVPAGSRVYVPNTASASKDQAIFQPLGRTEITGRTQSKPGVYMAYCAYPSCATVRLWKFGASTSRVVGSGQSTGTEVAIAAGSNGRLWVLWMRENTIWARRSNPSATAFGETVKIRAPALIQYKLDAEGSRGPLDVFVTAADDDFALALWHRRLQPGLTLTASPSRFGNDRARSVTFKVRDAGEPVGATVKVAGRTLQTGADGNVSTTFARGFREGRYTATATAGGYTKDTASLRVT